jgi:hypothetical protein
MGRFFQIRSHQLCIAAMAGLIAALDVRPSVADPDCTCRAQGRDFTLGQSACLATPKGARIATCAMVLNNTSWQFTETPCVVSHRPPAGLRYQARRAGVQTRHTLQVMLGAP